MKDVSASRTTREELLKWAQFYLQSRGSAGFSFQDLADRLKIRKASIHYYFRTKNDLLRELIQEYGKSFEKWAKPLEGKPAELKWNAFVSLFRNFTKDKRKICPAGAMITELDDFPTDLRRELCDFQIDQREWLEKMIIQGQDEGFFREDVHPRSTALLIGSTVQGSLQIARLHDSPAVFEKAMSELEKLLRT